MKHYSHDYMKIPDAEELTSWKDGEDDPWEKEWLHKKLEVIQLHVKGLPLSEIAVKTGAATQTVKGIITKFEEI